MDEEVKKNQSPLDWLGSLWNVIAIPMAAVLLALIIGAIILAISGANPFSAYSALIEGSFGSFKAFGRTLAKATPLIFSGLAVAFAFKAGLFNIGAQGQLLFGAIASAAAGFLITGLPPFLHATLALLIGAAAGALFAAIPGALKAYTGAHEVITTIMLNYVAINITDYIADGPLKDTSGGNIVARTSEILESARIPTLGEVPVGFFLAVLASVVVWWLLWHTTLGFEIRTVGLNPHAAKYAGMKVALTIILTMVISGFLAGIGGARVQHGTWLRWDHHCPLRENASFWHHSRGNPDRGNESRRQRHAIQRRCCQRNHRCYSSADALLRDRRYDYSQITPHKS